MGKRPTIGVLSPFVGGSYFGGILVGIARVTSAAGGQVIAIQTLDAGSQCADMSGTPDFRHPVAWEHISGFVTVINAVPAEYLASLRATGKPVVVVSHDFDGFTGPVVVPDNRTGVREAVAHLIEHGHRRIGFVGCLGADDVRERYLAYRETLAGHGIEPDPDLVFDSGNNQEAGGDLAAGQMMAGGQTMAGGRLPSTAVMVANDLNAIGLMRTLTAAGYQLPRDQAMVSFDDMDAAAYLTPSLSTVRQHFDLIGTTAARLLLDQLNGHDVPGQHYYVPTSFIVRESCGCANAVALPDDAESVLAVPPREQLIARLAAAVASSQVATGPDPTVVSGGAEAIIGALQAAAHGQPVPAVTHLREALDALYRLSPRPESLLEIVRGARQFGRGVADADPAVREGSTARVIEDRIQELILALSQTQARAQYGENIYFLNTLTTQYDISMDLLRSHEEDPRTLGWLRRTQARGGCLGLWSSGRPGRTRRPGLGGGQGLNLVGVFGRDDAGTRSVAARTTVAAFPPAEMLALAAKTAEDMVFVVPVKANTSDWGLLAVVGPVEGRVPTGRETMNQWAALLAVALDHEAVLESLRDQEERLRKAALYDALTGLPNRVLFLDRVRHAVAQAKRRGDYHFGVLFLDLDGFKLVNDSLGHSAGDELLVQVAERIKSALREVDTAARFGGDEFAVLLDRVDDLADPAVVAERLHRALATPFHIGSHDVVASASIGIALSTSRYQQAEDMIRDADLAMYTAKSEEKGTHAVFDVAMHTRAVSRLRTEAELRRAVERGELEVHYQPIVHLRTGETTAFEALLRWRHPTRGLLPPSEFLAVAEESGLMLPIGRWTMGEACRQLADWHRASPANDGVRISINVSNRQFWHGGLLDAVDDCLRFGDLGPQSLALEITEGVIMHNVELARTMLGQLHDRGLELHIDDFGTGYSSLEALHQLPIDALKIDRSFVTGLGSDPKRAELVRTIVLMGGNLGLDLIAEGIETTGQQDHLRRLGCAYGQGYWFSGPVPGDLAGSLICGPLPTPSR